MRLNWKKRKTNSKENSILKIRDNLIIPDFFFLHLYKSQEGTLKMH